MPTYNRHAYLPEAIDSILQQTMPDFELIIINDGSTAEKVLEILSEAERTDSRVRLVHQDNQGLAGARNSGVRCASAPLIALMDDDDISHPDRLLLQSKHLERNPRLSSVSTCMTLIDEKGFTKRSPIGIQSPADYPSSCQHAEAALATAYRVGQNATTMMRKGTFEQVGGYRIWFKQAEEIDFTLRLMGGGIRIFGYARSSLFLSRSWRLAPIVSRKILGL